MLEITTRTYHRRRAERGIRAMAHKGWIPTSITRTKRKEVLVIFERII